MKIPLLREALVSQDTASTVLPARVCMHVLGTASTDGRVMRAATALVEAGYAVSLVDITDAGDHQREEVIRGVSMKHVTVSRSFLSTRFDKWTLVKVAQLFVRSALR